MQSLSSKLYQIANPPDDDPYLGQNQEQWLWIWYWLFFNQPVEVITQELDQTAAYVESEELTPDTSIALLLKVEALEYLVE